MDNLDGVESDVVVASGTAAVDDSVAHIGKTYAAAGRIEAVEEGQVDRLRGLSFAESLSVVAVVDQLGNVGFGHFSGLDTFAFGSGAGANNGDSVSKAVGVAEIEYAVCTGDLECVSSVGVGGDVEGTDHAALEFKSSHKCGGCVDLEVFAVLGVLGVCILADGIDVSAEACYSLDGAEEVNHLVDIVTAQVKGEASAVVEGEEEVLGREIEEGSLRLVVRCALSVDGNGLADDTVIEVLACGLFPCAEEGVGSSCEENVILLGKAGKLKSLFEGGSHHLLAVNVLACGKGAAGDFEVRLGICKVNDDFDFLIRKHLLKGHFLYAVLVYHVLSAGIDEVAYCNDVDYVEFVHHVVHVSTAADTAAADNTDFDFSHSLFSFR